MDASKQISLRLAASLGIAALMSGCPAVPKLPDCVTGKPTPTSEQTKAWAAVPNATQMDLAIDGSGSMLGLTGSPKATNTWRNLLKGITLAAAESGLKVRSSRIGSGSSNTISSALTSTDPCFFKGCNGFAPANSSLESPWIMHGLKKGKPPLRALLSDLEVNDGDITKLVSAIRPHVEQGAVIGVLAVKLPFNGKVYNSLGSVIHNGEARRPVYLLVSGPRSQVHSLLNEIETKAGLSGVPANSMELTLLDEHVNSPTLTARSAYGIPANSVSFGIPIRIAGQTFNPSGQSDYQFAKLYHNASSVRLGSRSNVGSGSLREHIGLISLESIPLAGETPQTDGLSIGGFDISGNDLRIQIDIASGSSSNVVRAVVPRGHLPESWWLSWDRQTANESNKADQSDGLLLLLTSLGKLMVAEGTTPAASLCLVFSP